MKPSVIWMKSKKHSGAWAVYRDGRFETVCYTQDGAASVALELLKERVRQKAA